jgi:hypothetical protein
MSLRSEPSEPSEPNLLLARAACVHSGEHQVFGAQVVVVELLSPRSVQGKRVSNIAHHSSLFLDLSRPKRGRRMRTVSPFDFRLQAGGEVHGFVERVVHGVFPLTTSAYR